MPGKIRPQVVGKLTVERARRILSPHVVIRKSAGVYCVNFRRGDESTAYYTSDIHDAVRTGQAMCLAAEQRASFASRTRRTRAFT